MSGLRRYLQGNDEVLAEVKYPVTKKFKDENGNTLEWVLKPLSKEVLEKLYNDYIKKVLIEGKEEVFGYIFDSKEYRLALATKSVVYPNLEDRELQKSYGVNRCEDLLLKLVNNIGEYNNLCSFLDEINTNDVPFEDELEEIYDLIDTDLEASFAHYCLHKLRLLPSEYLALPRNERMFIMASIKRKTELEKEELDKI